MWGSTSVSYWAAVWGGSKAVPMAEHLAGHLVVYFAVHERDKISVLSYTSAQIEQTYSGTYLNGCNDGWRVG